VVGVFYRRMIRMRVVLGVALVCFASSLVYCAGAIEDKTPRAEAIKANFDKLASEDQALKKEALDYFRAVDKSFAAEVPLFTALLKDERYRVRAISAFALGKIGQAAVGALPEVEKLLTDSSASVQKYARQALERLRPFKLAPKKPAVGEAAKAQNSYRKWTIRDGKFQFVAKLMRVDPGRVVILMWRESQAHGKTPQRMPFSEFSQVDQDYLMSTKEYAREAQRSEGSRLNVEQVAEVLAYWIGEWATFKSPGMRLVYRWKDKGKSIEGTWTENSGRTTTMIESMEFDHGGGVFISSRRARVAGAQVLGTPLVHLKYDPAIRLYSRVFPINNRRGAAMQIKGPDSVVHLSVGSTVDGEPKYSTVGELIRVKDDMVRQRLKEAAEKNKLRLGNIGPSAAQCSNNLKRIYPAALSYATKKYEFPRDKTNEDPKAHDSLNLLLRSRHGRGLTRSVFKCLASGGSVAEVDEDDKLDLDEDTNDYAWAIVRRRPTGQVKPLAACEHHEGILIVLSTDSSVAIWDLNDPDIKAKLDSKTGLPIGLGR